MKFRIGTYTKKVSQGIYVSEMVDGKVLSTTLEHVVDNPTYVDHTKEDLFSVVKENDQGGIAVFRNGKFLNQAIEVGAPPCYVSYDVKNKLVYSANYHGGRINTYIQNMQGELFDQEKISFGEGSKAHYVQYDPSLNEVLVCDLGKDKVYFFKVNQQKLSLAATYEATEKSGPRHLVVNPNTKLIYLFTELSSELIVLKRTQDGVTELQKISTLPSDATTTKWGAAIRLSPDGKFVYVSNRAHDSLTVFKVIGESVEWVQNIPTYGIQPRDFNLSPDGQYLVAANLDTNSLSTYLRNENDGTLTLIEKEIPSFEPVCIRFEE